MEVRGNKLVNMTIDNFLHRYGYDNLNEKQRAAIQRIYGNTLLFAVPGSGKTTVIVARNGYMVKEMGINPKSILNLTFSRAAAREMKFRFLKTFSMDENDGPEFSTIHSFCNKVIWKCKYEKGEQLPALKENIKKIIRDIAMDMTEEYPSEAMVNALAQSISQVKNLDKSREEINQIEVDDIDFGEFYRRYLAYMAYNNLMDFDDQLIYAFNFLKKYPDVLDYYREKYPYISVDEAQDTSLIQHRVIWLLAKKYGNLFMVGDDDQSIYGFRGAYPDMLLNFKKYYAGAVTMNMEINYRSCPEIIERADAFINSNKLRQKKDMKGWKSEGGKIKKVSFPDQAMQYEYCLKAITECLDSNQTLGILYKNNESAVPLIDALDQKNIFVTCRSTKEIDKGADENLNFTTYFNHFLISDILNMLEFAQNPTNFSLYEKIYSKLGLRLKKDHLDDLKFECLSFPEQNVLDLLSLMPSYAKNPRVQKIKESFHRMKDMSVSQAMDEIYFVMDYRNNVIKRSSTDASKPIYDHKLAILYELAYKHEEWDDFKEAINRIKGYRSRKSNVTLSTMHSSKGLEFDKVIIIDALEGIIPSIEISKKELEEERRMFYVAVTRAKSHLEFLTCRTAFDHKTSSFIQDFLKSKDDKKGFVRRGCYDGNVALGGAIDTGAGARSQQLFKLGDLVVHRTFGPGKVLDINGDNIKIGFSEGDVKTFALSIVMQHGLLRKNRSN